MRIALLKQENSLRFVEMPDTHGYQLAALLHRLRKEVGKLTVDNPPVLPDMIAEISRIEWIDPAFPMESGLAYVTQLERQFAALRETAYPLVSLLTEIRALQAQLEQWYEEAAE